MQKKRNSKKEISGIQNKVLIGAIIAISIVIVAVIVLLILDYTGVLYSADDNHQTVTPPEISDETEYRDGVYGYKILKDGTAIVTSYTGEFEDREITVPSELGGYKVSAIGENSFYLSVYLMRVTISEGVTYIGKKAFYMSGMDVLDLPSTLEQIDEEAFKGCEYLMRINYAGDKENYKKIAVASGNSQLSRATVFYKN